MISLTEEFTNPSGRFVGYDAYEEADRITIHSQKHRDLRTLENSDNWTSATTGPDADREYYPTLTYAYNAGTSLLSSFKDPVDILTDFEEDDHFSIALPSFPSTTLNLASCFVDLTSNPEGDFATGPTVSLPFSGSDVPLSNGDSEFRADLSALSSIDRTAVTGVRFRISASGAGTLRITAIRILSTDWTQWAVDSNTVKHTLSRTVARDGAHSAPTQTMPILWRSDTDRVPQPIDAEVGVIFNTGASVRTNSVSLYFREVNQASVTQINLNGKTMRQLDGRVQPDYGERQYQSRSQGELDAFTQGDLDGTRQFDLEATEDSSFATWIAFTVRWGPGEAVSIQDNDGNGYFIPFDTSLAANTDYVFFAQIEETNVRATIYEITPTGSIGTQVFDSTLIPDDSAFRRRRGRFGWTANLGDADATISSISERSAVYAEYRSLPLKSNTPVEGAELFAGFTPNIELFQDFGSAPGNDPTTSTVTRDSIRSLSGSSYRIQNFGAVTNQGVESVPFLLTDFANSGVNFSIFYPSDAGIDPVAVLVDTKGNELPLLMPRLVRDQWQKVKINFPFEQTALTGRYSLIIRQPQTAVTTWWIDNVSIYSRAVTWEARAVIDDPWEANDAPWTPFKDIYNRESGGVLFAHRGTELQVRARANRQNAEISRVQFKPKYAELGRFAPTFTDRVVQTFTPTFTSTSTGARTLHFAETGTLPAGSYFASLQWNFGDGTQGYGPQISHTYSEIGTYLVTLVATDNFGNQGVYSQSVVV